MFITATGARVQETETGNELDPDSATLAAADTDDKSESSAGCNSPADVDADDDGDDMYGDLGDEGAMDEIEEDGDAGIRIYTTILEAKILSQPLP